MKGSSRSISLLQLMGNSQRFLGAVAVIGTLIALLQFVLVRQQVNGFLIRQMQQLVSQDVRALQRQIVQDQYLVEAVADLRDSSPNFDFTTLQQFVRIADHGQSRVSHIYLASEPGLEISNVSSTDAASTNASLTPARPPSDQLLIVMEKTGIAAPTAQAIDEAKKLAGRVRATQRSTAVVLPSRPGRDLGWLVYVEHLAQDTPSAWCVLGFVPLERLFSDFINRRDSGELSLFTVTDSALTTGDPFLTLRDASWNKSMLISHQAVEKVNVRDRGWDITYRTEPHQGYFLVAILPYIILVVGLLLTLALVMYLKSIRERGVEVANLADSLRRANEELSHRIAEEARMAHIVRESEQRFRGIFENAGIGICQIAPTGEWIKANRKIAQILGYADVQDLLLAQPDLHGELFVHPLLRRQLFERAAQADQSEYETELYTRNRGIIWANMNVHAVRNLQSDTEYFECTMYDVTERRNAEIALRQAIKQADFANRSKSEFLANMSHELRTPLNAIIGFSEIIRDQLFGPVGQAQYVEYAHDIHDSGDLLLSLINDILDMSKIEAGKRALAESEIDVSETVRSVVRLVSVRAKAGHVKLVIEVAHDLAHLRAEEKAIKQILTNLLTNAIKFTPEGGSVTLTVSVEPNGDMMLVIADTGIGMKPEDIPVAMTPFGQIESVLSRKNQGTGLGLPLTKALIELHGGEMRLESKLGQGTVVRVLMPASRVIPRKHEG